jgi:CBS domain-containing protein
MLDEPVRQVMDSEKFLVAAPDTTARAAARMMQAQRTSAVLVVDGGRLVGIFTERDAVFRVMAQGADPDKTVLAEVMTPDPKCVAPDESFGYALMLMHENGFRHVPVLEGGTPIGIVSARNALDPELEEFEAESRRRVGIRRKGPAA